MEPQRRRARSESGAGPLRARCNRYRKECKEDKLRWGAIALQLPLRKLAAASNQSCGKIHYWRRKVLEPATFHPQPHGGAYNYKFDPETRQMLENVLRAELEKNNTLTAPVLTVHRTV